MSQGTVYSNMTVKAYSRLTKSKGEMTMKEVYDATVNRKTVNLVSFSLTLLVICALIFTSAFTAFSDSPNAAQDTMLAQENPTVVARREFSRLPASTTERLNAIKDAKLRTLAQRVYRAMKALADNKSKEREGALVKEFDQAYLALFNTTQAGGYQTCTFKCKSDAQKCQGACKKKYCGCKLAGFACFVAECIV
jgi:hypothetical protein